STSLPRPPTSTLFPSTTLFRSRVVAVQRDVGLVPELGQVLAHPAPRFGVVVHHEDPLRHHHRHPYRTRAGRRNSTGRSVARPVADRKSTRLNSSHRTISYAVFC